MLRNSLIIFGCGGKDLNLPPLGYEFNNWLWMDSLVAKNQSHTVSMCWMISIVPGSPVSNLLALLGWQPTRFNPDNPGRGLRLRVGSGWALVGGLFLAQSREGRAFCGFACRALLFDTTTAFDTFQQP
jgi:hypothetical protein